MGVLAVAAGAGCGTLKDGPSDGVAPSGWQRVEAPPLSAPAPGPASLPAPAPAPAPAQAQAQAPKLEQSVKPASVSRREAAAAAAAPSAKGAAAAPEPRAAAVPSRAAQAPVAVATPAPPTLDVAALKARLRDTDAIGVFTKLALKNQVDDLLKRFRAQYQSSPQPDVTALRQPYNMLVLKVLALVQDSDPSLARTISASREAIWGILADRDKFKSAT